MFVLKVTYMNSLKRLVTILVSTSPQLPQRYIYQHKKLRWVALQSTWGTQAAQTSN